MSTLHTKTLKQRQMLAKLEADKVREVLKKKEDEKRAAVEKARRDAELDAEAAREELMRDQMQLEKEKKTKPYFVLDKFHRQVAPEQEPLYFGEFKRTKDAWMPHGSGQMLLEDKVHTDGNYVDGMLWGQGKYVERNGSVWEGTFYQGQMHGIGFYTENDFEKYPLKPDKGSESESEDDSRVLAVDRGDSITTNGGRFNTIGNRLEALMHQGELICYLKELEIGVQVELNDAALCVPLGTRATVIKHVKGWKFRCRMQAELNPRERQIDLSTAKHFRVLRELKMAYDMSAFSSGRYDGKQIQMDEVRTYDYCKDTYQLPPIKLSALNALVSTSSTYNSSVGATSGETTCSESSRYSSRKSLTKEDILEKEKADRAKEFLEQSQDKGPNLGIAGSRTTGEMRYLHTKPLKAEERKRSNYREQMFEARVLGIGKTLQADMDAEERERKKEEWAVILSRRRQEENEKKKQMVQEQQAIALAEASQRNAEKRKLKQQEDADAKAVIEAERLEWEKKQAEEELNIKLRNEERAQAKLRLR